MLIPQGYKQTEMGIIPKDWKIISILNIAELLSGLTYLPENISEQGLLVLRSSNIKDGNLSFEDNVYVNCIIDKNKYVKKNDILICVRNGSSNLIGKCALVTKNYNATFGAFMAVLRSPIGKYLYQVFSSQIIQKQIQKNCKATINQITKADFKNFYIPISINIKEQQSISEALYDTDKLIFSMQKLIDKKKAIKQGAMQELLTGKRRLSGFNSKWTEKKIYEIGKVITGSTPSRNDKYLWNGSLHWVSAQDLKNKYIFNSIEKITDKGAKYCNFLPAGAVLVTCIASIGLNAIARVPLATNQQINSIICNKDFYNEYIYYLLSYSRKILIAIADKTAVPIISKQNFESMNFLLPEDKKEQRAIAKILADMDNEIEKLEIKLQKYKKIKQGMMQQLLTGRIRLLD